jgi:uncharacterized membrane protein YhaH (DUF805 family)
MNWGQLLFSFEGRVGRATYWYFVLAIVALFVVLGMVFGFSMAKIDPETGAAAASAGPGGIVIGLASLLILWPSLAIAAKRWHDVDKSAWWILIGLVPAVGGIIALVFNGFIAGTPGANKFGPAPN